MNDVDRVFRDLDQKHNSYTKKFGLIKSRFDKLQGEIDELRSKAKDRAGDLQSEIDELRALVSKRRFKS